MSLTYHLEFKQPQQTFTQGVLSEAQVLASMNETLQRQKQPGSDVWIFAYGSLIWNPNFKFVERRFGTVYGLHRRFCLWSSVGRGTPDNPGLVLGLDRGGSCCGIIYRIAADDITTELLPLWQRKMLVNYYVPRWVTVHIHRQKQEAIAFVINRHHPQYAQNLSQQAMVNSIATARGQVGSSAEYLMQTVSELMKFGIRDQQLLVLQQMVLAQQSLSSNLS